MVSFLQSTAKLLPKEATVTPDFLQDAAQTNSLTKAYAGILIGVPVDTIRLIVLCVFRLSPLSTLPDDKKDQNFCKRTISHISWSLIETAPQVIRMILFGVIFGTPYLIVASAEKLFKKTQETLSSAIEGCDWKKTPLMEAQSELEQAKGEVDKKQAEITGLEAQLEQLKKSKGDPQKAQAELDSAKQEVDQKQAEIADLKAKLEKLEQSKGDPQKAQAELDSAKQEVDQKQAEIDGLEAKLERLEQSKGDSEKVQAELDSAKQEVDQKQTEIDGLKAQLEELEQSNEAAQAAQEELGKAKQEVDEKQAEIDDLKAKLAELEQSTEAAQTAQAELGKAKQGVKQKQTEIDGLKAKLKELEKSYQKQMRERKEQITKLESNLNSATLELEKKQTEFKELEGKVKALETDNKATQKALDSAHTTIKYYQMESNTKRELQQELEEKQAEIEKLKARVEELNSNSAHIESLTTRLKSLQKELAKRDEALKASFEDLQKAQDTISDMQSEQTISEQLKQELETCKSDLELLDKRYSEVRQSLETQQNKAAEAKKDLDNQKLIGKIQELEQTISNLQSENNKLNNSMDSFNNDFEELFAKIADVEWQSSPENKSDPAKQELLEHFNVAKSDSFNAIQELIDRLEEQRAQEEVSIQADPSELLLTPATKAATDTNFLELIYPTDGCGNKRIASLDGVPSDAPTLEQKQQAREKLAELLFEEFMQLRKNWLDQGVIKKLKQKAKLARYAKVLRLDSYILNQRLKVSTKSELSNATEERSNPREKRSKPIVKNVRDQVQKVGRMLRGIISREEEEIKSDDYSQLTQATRKASSEIKEIVKNIEGDSKKEIDEVLPQEESSTSASNLDLAVNPDVSAAEVSTSGVEDEKREKYQMKVYHNRVSGLALQNEHFFEIAETLDQLNTVIGQLKVKHANEQN